MTVKADVYMSAREVMDRYTNGDETGWQAELEWLWTFDRERTLEVMDMVLKDGYQEAILLGNDGRVWDGHHRIAVALALHILVPADIVP